MNQAAELTALRQPRLSLDTRTTPWGPEDHFHHIQAMVWETPVAGEVPELFLGLHTET